MKYALFCSALLVASVGVFAAENYKGAGVSFDIPAGFTVTEQPRKDGAGAAITLTDKSYSRTIYIRTYTGGTVDAEAALTETKHREAVVSGIPLSKWGESKRKIAGEDRTGAKADFANAVIETYVFKLGTQLVSVTLHKQSSDKGEAETAFAAVAGSLK